MQGWEGSSSSPVLSSRGPQLATFPRILVQVYSLSHSVDQPGYPRGTTWEMSL